MTERTIEQYEKLTSALAKLVLDQQDTIKALIEILSPEARDALIKIGRLTEKPLSAPKAIV